MLHSCDCCYQSRLLAENWVLSSIQLKLISFKTEVISSHTLVKRYCVFIIDPWYLDLLKFGLYYYLKKLFEGPQDLILRWPFYLFCNRTTRETCYNYHGFSRLCYAHGIYKRKLLRSLMARERENVSSLECKK